MISFGAEQQTVNDLIITGAELLAPGNALQITFNFPVFSGGAPISLESTLNYLWSSWYIRASNYSGEYVYMKLRPNVNEVGAATLFPAIVINNNYTCTITIRNHIQSTAAGILELDLLCRGGNNPFSTLSKYTDVSGSTNPPFPLLDQAVPITNNSTFTAWTPMLMRGIADWGAPKAYPYAFIGNYAYWDGFMGLTRFSFSSSPGHTVSPSKVASGIAFSSGGFQNNTPNTSSFLQSDAPVVIPMSTDPAYYSIVQTLAAAPPTYARSVSWASYDAGGGGGRCGFLASASGVSFRAFGNFTADETTGLDFLVWSSDGTNVRCVNGVNTQTIAVGSPGEFAMPGHLGWYPLANPAGTTIHGWIMAFRDQTPATDLLWQQYVADVQAFGDSVL